MTIPLGFSQATLFFTGVAVPNGANVVFGVQNSGGLTPGAIAGAINTRWTAGIMPLLGSGVTFTGTLVKNGPDATGPFASVAVVSPGGKATAGLTPNTAFLLTKNTSLGGREGRGRMYIPGPVEADVDSGGAVTAAQITAFLTAGSALLTNLNTDNIPMVLLHKSSTAPTLVTSLGVSTGVATQRRRLRR